MQKINSKKKKNVVILHHVNYMNKNVKYVDLQKHFDDYRKQTKDEHDALIEQHRMDSEGLNRLVRNVVNEISEQN
eukprot:UN00563